MSRNHDHGDGGHTPEEHPHGHDAGGHGHSHGVGAGRRRLSIALGIGLVLFVAQLIGSIITGSLALLFDTAHVLTDAAGQAMALGAAVLAQRPATAHHTWGLKRAEILAATVQAAVLLGVGVFVVIEAVQRFVHPEPVAAPEMILFGVIGLVGNIAALLVLTGGQQNLNLRAAFLEVVNDALGSVAVILSALIITWTGWVQADGVVALLIGLLIIPRALKILAEAVGVLLERTPPGLDLDRVRQHIEAQPHVVRVHDLHAGRISTDLPFLTAHVVLEDECFEDGHSAQLLCTLQECIAEHFDVSIAHSTIQLEPARHAAHEAQDFTV